MAKRWALFIRNTNSLDTPHLRAGIREGGVAEDLLGVGMAGSLTKIKQKMFLILNPSVIADVLICGGKGINHADPLDGRDLDASRNVFKGH